MNQNVLSPNEAKQARSTLMLSQKKVSSAVGLNRTVYALYEVGRYLLNDDEQGMLKMHFESLGYQFPERPKPPAPRYQLIKGIAIPTHIKTDKAKRVLNEIAQNDEFIRANAQELAEQHWFTEEPKPEIANNMIELMAYNYCHMRWLRGLDDLLGDDYAEDMKADETTHGALVNQRLYK